MGTLERTLERRNAELWNLHEILKWTDTCKRYEKFQKRIEELGGEIEQLESQIAIHKADSVLPQDLRLVLISFLYTDSRCARTQRRRLGAGSSKSKKPEQVEAKANIRNEAPVQANACSEQPPKSDTVLALDRRKEELLRCIERVTINKELGYNFHTDPLSRLSSKLTFVEEWWAELPSPYGRSIRKMEQDRRHENFLERIEELRGEIEQLES